MSELFLPGVPGELMRTALSRAGGNEIASGKFSSGESSAALAVNAFGWFVDRPKLLPAFPGLEDGDWPALRIDVERQMRFPWAGGRHPWLDAAIETDKLLIGVESKRFEPFRDAKSAALSRAYDRDVWGEQMEPWLAIRDRLRAEPDGFAHLDAAQLVKHAFGLVTEARRIGKRPVLFYLFAEPAPSRRLVTADALARHRNEISTFATAVAGGSVRFAACSYREWLSRFSGDCATHARRVLERFDP